MEEITVTAKIQIIVHNDEKSIIDKTMHVYCSTCNYVSNHIFLTHDLNNCSLNKALYLTLREKFGLKAQMAQSALKTVIAKYKTILKNQKEWIKPSFKKPQYDLVWNRDYSITKDFFSINTLEGRVKLSYFAKGMSKYFDHSIYKFGTAKIVSKQGKYFLYIPITYEVEESSLSDISNIVGIDRGINFIIATYNSNCKSGFVSGKEIKQKRASFSNCRKELQMRQTSSARRRLKAIGQRENRWMQDMNHKISKALVEGNPKHTLFVLEDLSGVRNATEKVRRKDRYVMVSWAFYDLEQKLIYKAKQNQCTVIKVDPHYTSQRCPICGHIEKSNRDKKNHLFTCKSCGYKSNDDRIGAMNLYYMGKQYLEDKKVPNTVTIEHDSIVKGDVNPPMM